MSLQDKIDEMLKAVGDDSKPEEYDNLVLDELPVTSISLADSVYLEKFSSVEILCMNQTGIRSLENLPKLPKLQRFELQENKLSGDELKHLKIYADTLTTLKLVSNNFTEMSQLEHLK